RACGAQRGRGPAGSERVGTGQPRSAGTLSRSCRAAGLKQASGLNLLDEAAENVLDVAKGVFQPVIAVDQVQGRTAGAGVLQAVLPGDDVVIPAVNNADMFALRPVAVGYGAA